MRLLHDSFRKIGRNQEGIALVSALILGLLGMLMVAALLLMVNTGTWMSGSKKRYQIALSAAHGGMNFLAKEIIPRGLGGTSLSAMGNYGGRLTPVVSNAHWTTKLTTTGRIGAGTYPNAPVDASLTFTPSTGPAITVNASILSTSRGNSSTSSNILQSGGVVNNTSGTITPQHFPYLYQIETRGQSGTNAAENARLSALYAY